MQKNILVCLMAFQVNCYASDQGVKLKKEDALEQLELAMSSMYIVALPAASASTAPAQVSGKHSYVTLELCIAKIEEQRNMIACLGVTDPAARVKLIKLNETLSVLRSSLAESKIAESGKKRKNQDSEDEDSDGPDNDLVGRKRLNSTFTVPVSGSVLQSLIDPDLAMNSDDEADLDNESSLMDC